MLLPPLPAMAVVELGEVTAGHDATPALMGLDLGAKTIGVAISDTSRLIASPLALLRRTQFTRDAEALFDLAARRGAGGMIIGLPVNMDGSEGPRCQSVRAFARNLLRLRDLPIAFWDERLSTVAVERTLIGQADVSRARRAELIDKMAAAWILQGALDRLRGLRAGPRTAF